MPTAGPYRLPKPASAVMTLTLDLNGSTIGPVAFAAGKTVATFTTTGANPFLVN